MDALAHLLQDVRADGALFGRSIMSPPWSVRFEDGAPLVLVTMIRGDGWIHADGRDPVPIGHCDVALVTGGVPFSVADRAAELVPPLYVMTGPDRCTAADGSAFDESLVLGPRTCGEQLDGPNALLTGAYRVQGRVCARLMRALPPVLVVPDEGDIEPLKALTIAEVERDAPGQQAMLDRLLDLLLLTTLRAWFARPDVDPPEWYRALGDAVVGRALRLMHDDPARAWTVASLAAAAGVSRATFARRFAQLVGEPPMSYLTNWRLSLAIDLLERTDATVESIARQVGYESGFGLSVAFKRVHGTRPSDHRMPRAAAGAAA